MDKKCMVTKMVEFGLIMLFACHAWAQRTLPKLNTCRYASKWVNICHFLNQKSKLWKIEWVVKRREVWLTHFIAWMRWPRYNPFCPFHISFSQYTPRWCTAWYLFLLLLRNWVMKRSGIYWKWYKQPSIEFWKQRDDILMGTLLLCQSGMRLPYPRLFALTLQ